MASVDPGLCLLAEIARVREIRDSTELAEHERGEHRMSGSDIASVVQGSLSYSDCHGHSRILPADLAYEPAPQG